MQVVQKNNNNKNNNNKNNNNMYNNGMQEDTYYFRFTNGIATFIARRLVQVICMTQFSSVFLRP